MTHRLTDKGGLLLGEFVTEGGAVPLSYKGDRHLLTVSPTRSGKGSTALVPNLLTYEGSTLVIDPKGENAMMTAQRRRDMGQDVYVVDPWMITASAGLEPSRFNLSLLKKHYGDGWQTFIANAGALQYFGSRDAESSEAFSVMCGSTTVWNFSSAVARTFGSSAGKSGSGSSSSLSETDTTSATQRRLAYADELARMQDHEQLLLVANVPPILGHRSPWFADDALKDLGRNLRESV